MFPWRQHTKEELLTEYTRLQVKLKTDKIGGNVTITPFSVVGYKCSNEFFQYERMNTPGFNRPSSIEYWLKNKENIIKFSNSQGRDYFSTVNYFNHAPSQFPVVTAGLVYKLFGATRVFDPYAGWGDRCLAAMAMDIDYIGIDCNKNLKKPFQKMTKFYKTNSNVKIIIKQAEKVKLAELDFDLVFTSPPFWRQDKMLEVYNHCPQDYTNFLSKSLIPIVNECLKRGVWVCLYIPDNMYMDVKRIIGPCQKAIKFKTNRTTVETIYCWHK